MRPALENLLKLLALERAGERANTEILADDGYGIPGITQSPEQWMEAGKQEKLVTDDAQQLVE